MLELFQPASAWVALLLGLCILLWALLAWRFLGLFNHRFCTIADLRRLARRITEGQSFVEEIETLPMRGIQRTLLRCLAFCGPADRPAVLDASLARSRQLLGLTGLPARLVAALVFLVGLGGACLALVAALRLPGPYAPATLAGALVPLHLALLIAAPALLAELYLTHRQRRLRRQLDTCADVLARAVTNAANSRKDTDEHQEAS